jgi:hypothetical protein
MGYMYRLRWSSGGPDMPFILPLEIQLHYPLHRHVNIRMGKSLVYCSSISY